MGWAGAPAIVLCSVSQQPLASCLQDASDDDKPLVVRQAQEERKQRREAKRAQAQPAHTSPAPALSGGSLGSGGVRPRRRASAGVVAATQALAAAAGVSGGGAPPKSPAQQHPSGEALPQVAGCRGPRWLAGEGAGA